MRQGGYQHNGVTEMTWNPMRPTKITVVPYINRRRLVPGFYCFVLWRADGVPSAPSIPFDSEAKALDMGQKVLENKLRKY